MPASLPPEITRLRQVARTLEGLPDTAAIMKWLPLFQAADAALKAERNALRRDECLVFLERFAPADGPARVFVLSFLLAASQDPKYVRLLHDTVSRPRFTLEQRHFFYWQLITRHAHIRDAGTPTPPGLYASLLEEARRAVNIEAGWIEPANRDPDTILVVTNQLLGINHAPTADCLDYCHVLQSSLGKTVLLINTGDMPWNLELPYYDALRFNYLEQYSKYVRLGVRGQQINFYQCRKPMPNREEMSFVLNAVLARKPAFVLSLGHSNVAADLCGTIVSVATMPFGTDLPRAASNVFVLPRTRRASDADFMQQWHIGEDRIIEAEYTFRLPERTASLSRAGLCLPDDAYVIAVVGNRLDEEITDAVAGELAGLLQAVPQAFLAFVGTFPGYGRLAGLNGVFETRSVFLGYQNDVPAVYECCDAYLNPPRYGGGSSAAFAMAAGLPVLTLATGDVANIAGERFVFDSFGDITRFVARSVSDSAHREEWTAVARDRFAQISDRRGMLETIVRGVAARADLRVGT